MIRLLVWLASMALKMPEPEITVTLSDIDPRRLDIEIKAEIPRVEPVIDPTLVVVYRDFSVGVYENDCFVGGSPVMIWA